MINLLIADDHTIFRQGLANLLKDSKEIKIVAEVGNGVDAWEKIEEIKPDIAILDFNMPGLNGLQIAELAIKNRISTSIVLLTMHDEPSLVFRAKENKVKGYVLKDDAFDELLQAIKVVASGGSYMSAVIAEKLEGYNLKQELSRREITVLKLITQGLTNNEIAEQLNISPKTVDTYRLRLMNKLGLHSIADLTKHAIKIGLVP